MDLSHDWQAEIEALRKASGRHDDADGVGDETAGPASDGTGDLEDEAQPDPVTDKWDSEPEGTKWLAAGQLGSADAAVAYRIDGWLAARGTSVWFGAGSTGKTQLMLWMAAMVASLPADRAESRWLGGEVNGTGHVLILTAEDTREQIIGRLRDVVTYSMGQDEAARLRTCARLHVMPFLSMSEREFKLPNPSLLEIDRERVWGPSDVMLEIRRYISEWNRLHTAPEDRIVGVVMDSATSMAGFDSLDAQATTNFFFYLGRLCERLRIFWAVIGHTPKTTSIPRHNAKATATSRLRGVAMWTTAPRLTVEVRLIQEWKERGKVHPEAPGLRAWLGNRVSREDILVVYVAKANLKGASRDERHLVRLERGAFVDVTERPDHLLLSGALDRARDRATEGAVGRDLVGAPVSRDGPVDGDGPRSSTRAETVRRGRRRIDPATLRPGTELVRELILATYSGATARQKVTASRVYGLVRQLGASDPRAVHVGTASGGGRSDARPKGINWHLEKLEADGLLEKHGRSYRLRSAGGGREA